MSSNVTCLPTLRYTIVQNIKLLIMDIWGISIKVNACCPPFKEYVPNDETEEKMLAFLKAFKEDTNSLLNINGGDGFNAGQAFFNTLTLHRNLNEDDQKFCIAGAILSFIKTLELGTMQSVMAIDYLKHIICSYRKEIDIYFAAMPDERMASDFSMPTSLVNTTRLSFLDAIKFRIVCFLKFLTALQNNQLDNSDNQTKAGQFYVSALFNEAYDRIRGYASFGFIS